MEFFRLPHRAASAVILAILACATITPAFATSLQVSPVRVEIKEQSKSESLWLSNTSAAPIEVQVRVYSWDQKSGTESLTPATDIIATPAITQVQPNSRQLVRVVLRTPASATERAYRILVEELPPADPVLRKPGMPALNLLLAYSIPLFIEPSSGPGSPTLSVNYSSGSLTVTNAGTMRAQVSDLSSVSATGDVELIQPGLVGYILAGQSMKFPVQVPSSSKALRATINQTQKVDWQIAR